MIATHNEANGQVVTARRHWGQKFCLGAAISCGLLLIPMLGLFSWSWQTQGFQHPWTPSAFAATLFLLSCAVVLWVMSRPQRPVPPM